MFTTGFSDCFQGVIDKLGRLTFAAAARFALISLLILSGCALLPEEKVDEIPTLIEAPPSRTVAYPVERMTVREEIRGLARVAPTKEARLYFTQSGRIFELNVIPGMQVSEGDVLIRLETGNLEHQLQMGQIDLELAKLEYERHKLGSSPYDVRTRELSVEKSKLTVEHLSERLEAATIRAPFDGLVRSVYTRGIGEIVAEYDPIIVVADPTSLELQMEVRRVEDINRLSRGQVVSVEVGRDVWQEGAIVQITEAGDGRSAFDTTKMVHIELEDHIEASGLRLDDLASVRIVVREREDTLVIPLAALREFMGRAYVRVLQGDARREVDVETGIRTQTHVEILKGLNEGDLVIGR